MIDAYAIGVTLKLNDLIGPQLLKLSNQFAKFDALALQVNKRLQKLGAEASGVRNVAVAAQQMDAALKGVGKQALAVGQSLRKIRTSIGSGGIGLETELVRANVEADSLARKIAAMRMAGRVPGAGGAPILPGAAGGHGGGRGPGHFHGGNVHVGPGGVGIGGVGMGLGANMMLPLAAAGATIYVGHLGYEAAKDLQTEQARFRLFGMSPEQNKSAYQFAHQLHAYGTSETQAMHFVNEAQAVFRESGESGEHALAGAKMAAPFLAKMMTASSILSEESKAKLQHESLAMLRAVELQGGAKRPEDFAKLADFGFRMTQTSGGQVNWEQLRQMYRTGGVAVQRLGMDAIAELEPIIGEFKGGSFATGMRTAYNRMNGIIKLPNQAVHELMKAGIWDAKKVQLNANGGIKRFLGNPLQHADEYAQNPAEYYYKYIRPFYDKQGYKDTDRDRMNAMFFGGTGGNLFSKIDQQQEVIKRAGEAFRKALGLDAAIEIAKGTASGAEADFKAAWTDFKTEFGKNVLPAVTDMLRGGADLLRYMSTLSPGVFNFKSLFGKSDGEQPGAPSSGGFSPGVWNLRSAVNKPIDPVAQKEPSMVQVKTDIKLDSRVLAQVTTMHQAKELSRPQAGPSTFDSIMSLRPPSMR